MQRQFLANVTFQEVCKCIYFQDALFHLELGQDIMMTKDIIYVSPDNRTNWVPLHKFEFVCFSLYLYIIYIIIVINDKTYS